MGVAENRIKNKNQSAWDKHYESMRFFECFVKEKKSFYFAARFSNVSPARR